jgi:hypothetical protein
MTLAYAEFLAEWVGGILYYLLERGGWDLSVSLFLTHLGSAMVGMSFALEIVRRHTLVVVNKQKEEEYDWSEG